MCTPKHMHTCAHTTHTCTHEHTHKYTHAHTHTHTRTQIRVHTLVRTHTHTRPCTHTHPAVICTAWMLAPQPCREAAASPGSRPFRSTKHRAPRPSRTDPCGRPARGSRALDSAPAHWRSGFFRGGRKRVVSGGARGGRPAEGVLMRWCLRALGRGKLTPCLTTVLLVELGKSPTSRPAGWGGLCLPLALPRLGAPAPTEWARPDAKVQRRHQAGQSGSRRFQKRRRRLRRRGGAAARPLCWTARARGWDPQGAGPVIRAPGTLQGRGFCFPFRAVGGCLETRETVTSALKIVVD